VAHEHIDSADAERSQMRWSFWLIAEARSQSKLDIILQREEQPRICWRLIDAGSESFSKLRKCLSGKV
jgi:hypothetical protein